LESDLELEKCKSQEFIKEIRRLEKRSKELVTQVEEEQQKVLSLTESHEKLQEKMRKYRGQIEGAEGQVAINLSRCRRLQRELEDAEERAETMSKTLLRSGSVFRYESIF
jgi:myosin heavy chain 1/2/3/4/8/13/7B/15